MHGMRKISFQPLTHGMAADESTREGRQEKVGSRGMPPPSGACATPWRPASSEQDGSMPQTQTLMDTTRPLSLPQAVQQPLILLIDDSPTVRKIVEITLGREGFQVLTFADGVEVLEAIVTQQLERVPDLLLLDITLPKMDGYQLARHLRARPSWQQVAIVMLTRHNGVLDRLKARLIGARGYLNKPFTTEQLLITITQTLNLPTPSTTGAASIAPPL